MCAFSYCKSNTIRELIPPVLDRLVIPNRKLFHYTLNSKPIKLTVKLKETQSDFISRIFPERVSVCQTLASKEVVSRLLEAP